MSSIILNGFRDTGIWLYTVVLWLGRPVLSFPPAVLRHCLKHVNLCEASVGCCEKCRISSQTPIMLILYMFMASAMVVSLLLLKNTVDGFLCAEFRIVVFYKVFNTLCECGTLPSVYVSSERTRKRNMEEQENILDMVQLSPTTSTRRLSARFTKTCKANIAWRLLVNISPTACSKSTPRGQCHAFRILYLVIY